MPRYIIWRLLKLPLSIYIVLTLVFFAFHFVPGDPAQLIAGQQTQLDVARVRTYLGLDDPIYVQYIRYLRGIIQGDLGKSAIFQAEVSKVISSRLLATLVLLMTSIFITIGIGVPAGVISAVKSGSIYDYITILAVVGVLSIPNFWLGLLMINFFSVKLGLLPAFGFKSLSCLIMPSIAIAARLIASVARMTRGTMLEVIGEDYIQVARAKGLKEWIVIYKHALKNALIPIVTTLGLQMGYLLGGSIVIEVLFAWPGIGHLMIDSINMRDYNMVQGVTVIFVTGFLLINLAVDIIYNFLDPRLCYD